MLVVRTSLPQTPGSVPAARRAVRAALVRDSPAVVEVAELQVTDGGERLPERVDASLDRADGFGLHLVAALSADWGVSVTPGHGKTVWCRISPSSA